MLANHAQSLLVLVACVFTLTFGCGSTEKQSSGKDGAVAGDGVSEAVFECHRNPSSGVAAPVFTINLDEERVWVNRDHDDGRGHEIEVVRFDRDTKDPSVVDMQTYDLRDSEEPTARFVTYRKDSKLMLNVFAEVLYQGWYKKYEKMICEPVES